MFNGFDLSTIQDAKFGSTQVAQLYYGSHLIWPQSPQHDYSLDYLTFDILPTAGAVIDFSFRAEREDLATRTISYSLDNGTTWTQITSSYNNGRGTIIGDLNPGDKIMFKGINTTYNPIVNGTRAKNYFAYSTSSANIEVSGNIMSLLYGDNFINQTLLTEIYTFESLFGTIAAITSAKNLILPATTLTDYCYYNMFGSQTLMVEGPQILPATTLAPYCYGMMFNNCWRLLRSPEIHATTLNTGSCKWMFSDCLALNEVHCYAQNISATECLYQWMYNVAASGTFYKDTNTTYPSGDSGIPANWTVVNI